MRMKKFAAVVLCCAPALALTACSKPSESEVHDAVVKIMTDQGADKDQAEAYADCAAPKMVDKVSRTGLNNLVDDGKEAKGTDDDVDAMSEIDKTCTDEVLGSTSGN